MDGIVKIPLYACLGLKKPPSNHTKNTATSLLVSSFNASFSKTKKTRLNEIIFSNLLRIYLARLLLLPFFYKLQEINVQSDSLVRFPNTSEDNKHVCEVDVLASFECVWLLARATGNSGRRLGALTRERLLHGNAFEGYREISVGLGNEGKQPTSFSSPPVAGADFVTILNEEASLSNASRIAFDDPFAITKYVLTMHAFQPIIDERVLSLSLSYLEDELNSIPEEYDLGPEISAR
ncbi:MAG: hypothetical protein NWF13_07015 [Candidatus Bathyarchaeota archaeon]|nr:hypothetical protein [Candidatus Bathyarchaeota archaeon]